MNNRGHAAMTGHMLVSCVIVKDGRTDLPLKENITRSQFVRSRVLLNERLVARHGGATRNRRRTRDGYTIIGVAVDQRAAMIMDRHISVCVRGRFVDCVG